ncbi:type I secretion system permease/ATPase [Oceanobacter mangrovi]|uniref:type I secretion system permease/ATPase n=1 Tax=Oceanobacter mangrovi TaxID=2862510 RepID=UPI001C8DD7B4|nr:type I secretion system permease/ATPase [Oceanobacter mangrovi]
MATVAELKVSSSQPDNTEWTPLLQVLVLFAARYRRPVSIASLIADLPVQSADAADELLHSSGGPALFANMALRAGFQARLTERPLERFSSLLLPCVLLLQDGQACVLEQLSDDGRVATVLLPEFPELPQSLPVEQLQQQYLGFAWLLKSLPQQDSEQTARHDSSSLADAAAGQHWFFDVLWRGRGMYLSVIVASVFINLFVMATPLFTMNVYDRVVPNDALDTLWVFVIGVVLVYLADTALRFLRTRMLEIAARKSDLLLSARLFRQAQGLSLSAFPDRIGNLVNSLREFDSVRQFLASTTLVTLVDLPFAVLFLLMIGWLAGPVVLIPLAAMVLLLLAGGLLAGPLRRSIERGSQAAAAKNSLLIESLSQLATLRSCNHSRQIQFQWEQACGQSADVAMRSHLLTASLTTVTGMMVQLTTVLIILAGVYQVHDQQLTLGGLLAAVILSSRAVAPMAQAASLLASYQQTRAVWQQLDGLMQLPTERSESGAIHKASFTDSIQLQHVSLSYGESPVAALQDINLTINKGERVGIIGRAGSGKSSLASLLAGLYRPTAGQCLIDGIDLNLIEPGDLRQLLSVQLQDAGLLRGTIRSNVVMRQPQATDEQVHQVVMLSGLARHLSRQSAGLDTPVAEAGRGLSGGQKQAVMLARSLLDQAPVLVLDEPTSAMDSSSEALVRQRLQQYLQHTGQTLLLITHKQGMLALVDRLIVLDEGRVVLDGPRDQVLKALAGQTVKASDKTQGDGL